MALSGNRTQRDRDSETGDEATGYTLVRFGIPIEGFALHDTLVTLPDVEFECDQTVQTPNRAVMPLVWVRGVHRSDLEPVLDDDSSVQQATLVEECGDELLYRMEWASRLRVLTFVLSTGDSLFRDARGTSDGWTLQVLYSSRSHLSEVSDLCGSLDVEISINSIRQLVAGHEDEFGLTDTQLEALSVAHEMGYFEVPRAAYLDAVAAELGLSHQSLSELLRRGHDALIQNTIQERNHGCDPTANRRS